LRGSAMPRKPLGVQSAFRLTSQWRHNALADAHK
jgi:hypothetical protein